MRAPARQAATAVLGILAAVLGLVLFGSLIYPSDGQPPTPSPAWCAKHPNNPKCQTPTPTVTTTAPTPSDTPGTCTTRTIIEEGAAWSFGANLEYLIHNNNWNDNYGGTHVISACSENDWWVDVNVRDHSDNAVEAYPNVHKDYNDIALSRIVSADFAGVGPKCAGCIYNTAFDIWIGSGLTHELMIWTENWNQRPAGNQVDTVVIGGHTYQVWRSGTGDGGIFSFVSVPEQLSGTMPLTPFFDYVRAHGWTPTTTWQVDFGVETVDTNGTTQRFTFTKFAIHEN